MVSILGQNASNSFMNGYNNQLRAGANAMGNSSTGLSFGNIMGGVGSALQGFSSLGQLYMGFKALQQAEDQFDFSVDAYNKDLSNQAKIVNNQIDTSANLSGQLSYSDTNSQGLSSQQMLDDYKNKAKDRYVDGSPVSA